MTEERKPIRILFADDDFAEVEDPRTHPYYRRLEQACRRRDYTAEICIAEDGESTHWMLLERQFDALILDIMMPQGDGETEDIQNSPSHKVGFVLFEKLQKGEYDTKNKDIRVAVFTATGYFPYEIAADAENRRVVYKPALFSNLVEFIIV